MSDFIPAFGPSARAAVIDGDEDALLQALIALAASWAGPSGVDIADIDMYGPAACVTGRDGGQGGLLAASIELMDVIRLSLKGREAIAKFVGEPLLQQTEGERGGGLDD